MRKNKKGLAGEIVTIMMWSVVLIFVVLLVYLGTIILPVATPILQEVGDTINTGIQESGSQELANASQSSIVPATKALNNMEWIAYTLMILMFFTFVIMCFYVRTYPFLIWVWIIMMVVMIFCSIYLTVAYQDLREDPTLGSYYKDWGNTDFILRNLPIVVFALGVIGGIIMFAIAPRDSAQEQVGGGPL